MKVCPHCSAENSDYDWFCKNCGTALGKSNTGKADPMDVLTGSAHFTPPVNGEESAENAPAPESAPGADAFWKTRGKEQRSRKQGNRLFIDPGEELRASIGSGYVQNFLSGGHVSQSVGALTQRRFYYKGKNYNSKSRLLWSTEEEGVVSVDDIGFTGFSYTSATGLLIIGIVLAIVGFFCLVAADNSGARIAGAVILILGVLVLVRYYLSRDTQFIVSFPGGSFGFDTKLYSIADIQNFQRQLHLIKDQMKEEKRK